MTFNVRQNMKTIKIISRYLLAYMFCGVSFADDLVLAKAGAPAEHLQPIGDAIAGDGNLKYRERLFAHLCPTSHELGFMMIKPSFTAESAVSIYSKVDEDFVKSDPLEKVPESKIKYFITYTKAKDSLWYSMRGNGSKNIEKVKVSRVDRQISKELAIAIQNTWATMLFRSRYPREVEGGFDGITYEFAATGGHGSGLMRAKTTSPYNASLKKFVALAMKLVDHSKSKGGVDAEEEKKLITELQKFRETISNTNK